MADVSTQGDYREVVVASHPAGRETVYLLLAILVILLLMALRFSLLDKGEDRKGLKSYQIADIRLKSQAPALYRALAGSARDILFLHEDEGSWPDVEDLRQEGIPPFAPELLPAGLRGFHWEIHQSPGVVDYFGVNRQESPAANQASRASDPLKNSFLLRIIDVQSSEHPYPYCQGAAEEASRYSIQVWVNPQITDYPVSGPIQRGWKWVVSPGSFSCNRIIEAPPDLTSK